MDALGLRGELVDGGGVDGVLALLRALDIALLAARPAEGIAFEPLPARAASAAAFRGKCRIGGAD